MNVDTLYAELRHAVERLPFEMLVDLVCGGEWCDDGFPCPDCQRGSSVPSCTAQGNALYWRCIDRNCGASGTRADLERLLLDGTRTVADAHALLATIRAVAS